MREVRLRKLARPLPEARKEPMVNKAALCVERLFGRPMRASPDILIVTPQNREEFLECVKHDFGHHIVFVPSKEFIEEEMKPWIKENTTVIDLNDLKSPLETYRKYLEVAKMGHDRVGLQMIGGVDNRSARMRLETTTTEGMSLNEENIIVIKEGDYPSLVHEIIHAEDFVLFGGASGKLERVLHEGRACFGENIFSRECGEQMLDPELMHLESFIRLLFEKNGKMLRAWVSESGLRNLGGFLWLSVKGTSLQNQTLYMPFFVSLYRLSDAVGDPYRAFRIATDKMPQTRREMKRPLEFYKDEIKAAVSG